MPKPQEVASIQVKGKRYLNWQTVSVTRSGVELFPKFAFTAAAPAESAPDFASMKLGIGDPCEVYLGGRQAVAEGRITGRQPAYDAKEHGLQITGTTRSQVIARSTIDHEKGEFKNYSLSQIANAVLKPYGVKFSLKGDTSDADKVFPKVNVQVGETVFEFIERLCRFRNIYLLPGQGTDIIGYRLKAKSGSIAELEEGRNILAGNAVFDYGDAFSEIQSIGQQPGNDQTFGDASRDVTATVKNSAVIEHAPLRLIAEMPGDQADMRMRAQHENGFSLANQVNVNIKVQGWFKDQNSLWLEHIGDVVSVYSPMLFTKDRMQLAIQAVTSSQGPQGTTTDINLVLPKAYNGGGQTQSSAGQGSGGTPAGLYT
ncbi:phage baseplate assembly protein [Methylobacterium sp. A49B]